MAESPTTWGLLFGVCAYVAGKVAEAAFAAVTSGIAARETRRDTAVIQLEKVVLETRDLAVEYWARPGIDPDQKQRSASIVARLKFAMSLCTELFETHDAYLRVEYKWINFHEACTFGDFGSVDRAAQPERASDIEMTAYALIHEVTTSRYLLPQSLWRRRRR